MNKIYRVIWNATRGLWQVAAEIGASRGKTQSQTRAARSGVVRACSKAGGVGAGALLLVHSSLVLATLPTDGTVTAGTGSIRQSGGHMTIDQTTPKMAIDWQGFSIGRDNSVTFNQPSSSAVALNRVLGSDVSVIQGAINANGQVFLVNPNGVLFTPTAQVNVGGMVASTLSISNEDFMAGNYRFEGASGNAVINKGNIQALGNGTGGGFIAMIAAKIENTGSLTAQKGDVLLGAGSKVTLDLGGPVKIEVDAGAIDALIEQGGAIRADGGLVYLTAKAAGALVTTVINHTGITQAQTLATGQQGEIYLMGDPESGNIAVAGILDASAPDGGSGGTVWVSGNEVALTGGVGVASGEAKGGRIVLEGDHITLAGGSLLDATGTHGGGEVLVGGDWQGSGDMYQATTVTMAQGATIDVSATQVGDGGTAVLWSDIHNPDSQTRAHGTIWAKGGAEGGDGGRIETSGYWLDIAGSQGGASATNGKAGEWLLDPYNVTITSANANGSFVLADGTDTWTPNADNSTILNTDINSKLNAGTNVTITTTGVGTQDGNITVASSITKTGATETTLTLKAHNNIILNSGVSISSSAGNLNTILWADSDANSAGHIGIGGGASILTNGGDIILAGGLDNGSNGGTAGDGIPDGFAFASSETNKLGVSISATASLNAGGGNILIRGKTAQQTDHSRGIENRGEIITNGSGTITLVADSSALVSQWYAYGMYLSGSSLIKTDSGTITLTGAGAQHSTGHGVVLEGSGVSVESSSGDINIEATGSSTAHFWMGASNTIGKGNLDSSSSSDITITANSVSIAGVLESSGALTIHPRTASTTIGIAGGSGILKIPAVAFSTYFTSGFSNITIGSANSGTITIGGATTFRDSTTLLTNSSIALNGAVTANENLTLTSNGAITQSAALAVTGTTSITAGSANNITLESSGNNFGGAVTVVSARNLSLIDSNALTLGAVNTTGTVDIATLTDNLTLTGAVATTNATADAIKLNAGKNEAPGTAAGGNIIVSGGSVAVGADGRATLFSGSVSGSTGLTALVGTGRFRYNADESTDFATAPWTNLGTGIYAIYREQPTISVTPQSQNITYGNSDPTSYTASYNDFVNGDTNTDAAITGTATWSTAAGTASTSGNRIVGAYDVAYTNGLLSGLGYGFADASGSTNELNVQQLALTVTGLTADNKVYDAATTAMLGGTAAVTALGTDAVTLGGTAAGAFVNKNVGDGKAITVSGLTLTGDDAGNYTLVVPADLVANITPANLTVTGLTAQNRVYDATTIATLGGTAAVAALGIDSVTLGGSVAGEFDNKNVGDNKAITVSGLTLTGDDAGNYTLIVPADLVANITPRPITVTAEGKNKLAGEVDPALTYLVEEMAVNRGLVEGESITGELVRDPGESVGSYTIGQGTVDEQNNPNYSVAFIGAELAIDGLPTPEPTTEPFDQPITDVQQLLFSSDSPSSGLTPQSNPAQSLSPEGGQVSDGQSGFTSGGVTYVSLGESADDAGDADEGAPDSSSPFNEGGRDGSGFMRVFVVNGGINLPAEANDAVEDSGEDDDANLGQGAGG